MNNTIVATAALILLAAGCGGPPPAQTPSTGDASSPTDAGGDATPSASEPASWADMSKDQKIEHMKEKVIPKMGEVFASFDADRYGKITCATCHGPGAKHGEFEMPNADLPKLTMPSGDGEPFAEEMEEHPAITKFMMEKVTPEMVKLLPGVQPYDPATHEGFGCFGCHTSK